MSDLPGAPASQIKELMIPTDIPPRPWHTVGVDLFHLDGVEYLLTADCYSKIPFVRKLGSQTAFSVQLTSPPPWFYARLNRCPCTTDI